MYDFAPIDPGMIPSSFSRAETYKGQLKRELKIDQHSKERSSHRKARNTDFSTCTDICHRDPDTGPKGTHVVPVVPVVTLFVHYGQRGCAPLKKIKKRLGTSLS